MLLSLLATKIFCEQSNKDRLQNFKQDIYQLHNKISENCETRIYMSPMYCFTVSKVKDDAKGTDISQLAHDLGELEENMEYVSIKIDLYEKNPNIKAPLHKQIISAHNTLRYQNQKKTFFHGIHYSCNIAIFQKEDLPRYLDQMLNACRNKTSLKIKSLRTYSIFMIVPNANMGYHCSYLLNCKRLNYYDPENVDCLILLSYQKTYNRDLHTFLTEKIARISQKFKIDQIRMNDDPLKFHYSEIALKYDENVFFNVVTTSEGCKKRKKNSSANILKFYNPKYNQPLFSIEIIEPLENEKHISHSQELSIYKDPLQNSNFQLLFEINICGFFEQKKRSYCIKIDNADNFRIFYRNFNERSSYSSYDSKSQNFSKHSSSCQIAVEKIMVALTKTFIDLVSRLTIIYTFHDAFDFHNLISAENVMYTRFLMYQPYNRSLPKFALGESSLNKSNEFESNQELCANLYMSQDFASIGHNSAKLQICDTISYDFLDITYSEIYQHNMIMLEWKILEILQYLTNIMLTVSVDFDLFVFSSYCRAFFANYSSQDFKKFLFEIDKCMNQTLTLYPKNHESSTYSEQNQNSDETLDGPPKKKAKKIA